jgi:uncharacterized protein (TIGR00288 family)
VKDALLIKPKGVDIALAVRMLEDATYNNFDRCILVTSDIDYLPAINAVRRMGKQVSVLGFQEGIANDSPFMYVVEGFVDLELVMRDRYLSARSPT